MANATDDEGAPVEAAAARPSVSLRDPFGVAFHGLARAVNATRKAVPNPMAGVQLHMLERIPRVKLSNWAAPFKELFKQGKGLRHTFGDGAAAGDAAGNHDPNAAGYESDDDQAPDLDVVDTPFFDPAYEAARAELTRYTTAMDDKMLLAELEKTQVRRLVQLRAVHEALKKSLLDRSDVFLKGIEQVRAVDEDLAGTAQQCAVARRRLETAKRSLVHQSLYVLQYKRRCVNLTTLIKGLDALNWVRNRELRVQAYVTEGKYADAHQTYATPEPPQHSDFIRHFVGARPLLARAEEVATNPSSLLANAIKALEQSIADGTWSEAALLSALGGFASLDRGEDLFNILRGYGIGRVGELFRKTMLAYAELPVATSGSPVTADMVPSPDWTLDRLSVTVPRKDLVKCVVAILKGCAEIVVIFSAMRALVVSCEEPEIQLVRDAVKRACEEDVALEMHDSIVLMFSSICTPENLNDGLHCCFVASMFIESTHVLGVSRTAMNESRDKLVAAASKWVEDGFVAKRCALLLEQMCREGWLPDHGASVKSLQSIDPVKPDHFKDAVKWTRGGLTKMTQLYREGYKMGSPEVDASNPFCDPRFTEVRDESSEIRVRPMELFSKEGQVTPFLDHFSPLLPSTGIAANSAFEVLCRVLPRVPPLASQVLTWIEEIMSVYIYLVADSFVATQREPTVESVSELSFESKTTLIGMRLAALRGLRLSDAGTFPRLWEPGSIFTQDAYHFGRRYRLMALAATIPLVHVVAMAIDSCAPVMPPARRAEHEQWVVSTQLVCQELIHVGCHRLAAATFSVEQLTANIKAARFDKAENTGMPSAFVEDFDRQLEQFAADAAALEQDDNPPPPQVAVCFARHIMAVVNNATIRGLASNPLKFTSTNGVLQMSIDAQSIHEKLWKRFKSDVPKRENHVKELIEQALVPDAKVRIEWVKRRHATYDRQNLTWFLGRDMTRQQRQELEAALAGHDDEDVLRTFIRQGASWSAPTVRPAAANASAQSPAPSPPPPARS